MQVSMFTGNLAKAPVLTGNRELEQFSRAGA